MGLELIDLVNDYRQDNGLARIPASSSLCTVASAHTRDLADHRPHDASGCNLHSWSDEGDWEGCCYTSDHANAACMWNKPGQITSYPGIGYENSAAGASTAASALAGWQTSSGHNQVILNQGGWASRTWRAVGADVHGGFAHLWFGEAADPAD